MTGGLERWIDGLAVPGRPDEFEAKRLLAARGIAVPAGFRLGPTEAAPPSEALARRAAVGGADGVGPAAWVVKACTPGLAHKTEAGAVALGVAPAQVAAAIEILRGRFPGAAILVEEEIAGTGPEFIAGGLTDPSFGKAVMVGSGGILTELAEDVTFRLAPCSPAEARRMLEELVVAPVFRGYRGLALDAGALAEVVHRVGELLCDLGDRGRAMDVNPLVFAGGRWVALDARIELGEAPRGGDRGRR